MKRDWLNRPIPVVPGEVAEYFEQYTLFLIKRGFAHYGGGGIMQRIRWHMEVEKVEGARFKINENWMPCLTRWFMQEHPEHEGFFRTRKLRCTTPGLGGD